VGRRVDRVTRRRVRLVASTVAIGAVALGAVVFATSSLLSCRQIAGITSNPVEDLTTHSCGLPYGSNACTSCASTSCCSESTTCAADPVCAAYEGCLGQCNGDADCRSQCTIDHQVGTSSDVSALSACLASKCETACGLGCGALAGYIAEPRNGGANSCQTCVETHTDACTHARACGTSAPCDAYWRCVLSCSTEDCRLTCATDNPAGAALFASFQADYSGTCADPCAFGNYWACVGRVYYPTAKSASIDLRFPVVSFSNPAMGVPGLDISTCTGCPCGAAYPTLATGRTDDAGVVSLPDIPQPAGTSAPGLEGCHQISSPDKSIVPAFEYWGYPISEPVVTIPMAYASSVGAQTVTPAELAAFEEGDFGVMQDDANGYVSTFVHDCLGALSPGVEVTSDNKQLSATYSAGEVVATTSGGFAVFFNAPPGVITVTATPLATGKKASSYTLPVAKGTMTGIDMFPTP
jgi:hypothetical protein